MGRRHNEVADEEKRRKAAEDHARMHEDHAQAGAAREAAGQSIPPEILEQLKAKVANQPQGGQPAPPHGAH
jgi:hypothetical protein